MTERPSDEAERRLRLARDVFSPAPAARERVWAGLAARGATFPAATTSVPLRATRAPSAAQGSRSAAPGVLAVAKGGALIAVGFALGVWFSEARSAAPLVPASAPESVAVPLIARALPSSSTEPAPVAEPAPVDVMQPPGVLAPPGAARQLARGRTTSANKPALPARSPASSVSAEELALLQRAERAIRAGDGALARSFIAELEARFPKTAWREEREAILVLAACAEQAADATRSARSFLERHPSSVYFDRIGSLCRLTVNRTPRLGH